MSATQQARPNLAAEQRRLTHQVASATDEALIRVVAAFDRMADRREADRLLDAARPRLRQLRPPRPIAFTRLLFLPLDGVILPAAGWRRASGGMPRSVLLPLGEAMRAALGAGAAALDAQMAGRHFGELMVVAQAGRALWRLAAVAPMEMPRDWAESGLNAADFTHCLSLAQGVWRQADPLWAALIAAREGPPAELVRALMEAAAQEEPRVIEALLATLLTKAAHPGSVVAAAGRGAPPGLADRMLDRWIEECRPEIPTNDTGSAARVAEEFAEALADLDASGAAARQPERRQKIHALRRGVDEACRTTFGEVAKTALLAPLAGPVEDKAMGGMEMAARDLKRLERAGRSLGSESAYDAALHRVTDSFAALRGRPGVNVADVARLTEILAGPEAALRMLDGA